MVSRIRKISLRIPHYNRTDTYDSREEDYKSNLSDFGIQVSIINPRSGSPLRQINFLNDENILLNDIYKKKCPALPCRKCFYSILKPYRIRKLKEAKFNDISNRHIVNANKIFTEKLFRPTKILRSKTPLLKKIPTITKYHDEISELCKNKLINLRIRPPYYKPQKKCYSIPIYHEDENELSVVSKSPIVYYK